jgi:glycosyltransferase involved in cell wall biosynthesis
MKIVHLSISDTQGGAARAAFRLHSAMVKSGLESSMLVLRRYKNDNSLIKTTSRLHSKLIRPMQFEFEKLYWEKKKNISIATFAYPFFGTEVTTLPVVKEADVIYLHWICEFLNLADIEHILKLGKPVYWFLHDMWAMTGGCFYSHGCSYYEKSCGNCPQLPHPSNEDLSYKLLKKKAKIFNKYANLHIITPSNWLGECARKSALLQKKNIHVIPNPIDTKMYKPLDKSLAKQLFNLPPNKKILLFSAGFGSNNPVKGGVFLCEALNQLAQTNIDLAVFILGIDYDAQLAGQIPFPVYFSGKLEDDYALVMLYNAADIYVTPSLADNFPNTIVESLACNTPVVAFNIGGIPDLVKHKKNGYLANYKDSNDLAYGIDWVLKNPENLTEGRILILNLCAEKVVVEKHQSLF